MNGLLRNSARKINAPVECLGAQFPNEDARRSHFLRLLAAKLKDPVFRKQEGFPKGTDGAMLAISDPPYYTACPNPFLTDYVQHCGREYDAADPYSVEPLVADVSEGKNDQIYNAHSYHTKVPHKAIMRYILHYTKPGDIVLDSFCGTGMTGVASQLCGDRREVESLGYRIDDGGTVLEQQSSNGKTSWRPISQLGTRSAILTELLPAASFIAANYNTPVDVHEFQQEAEKITHAVEKEFGWMFRSRHSDTNTIGKINFTLWSDVFICSECSGAIIFWDVAADKEDAKVREDFNCLHCSARLKKRSLERAWSVITDPATNRPMRQAKQLPVLINYSVGSKRFEKRPDQEDVALITRVSETSVSEWYPADRMMDGGETRRNDPGSSPKRVGKAAFGVCMGSDWLGSSLS